MGKDKDKKQKKSKRNHKDNENSQKSSRSGSKERQSRSPSPKRSRSRSRSRSRRRHREQNYNKDGDRYYEEDEQQQERQSNRGEESWHSSGEETRNLCVESIECDGQIIEKLLTGVSIEVATSLPDEVDLRNGNAYVKYPSGEAASMALDHLKGFLKVNNKSYKVDFFPFRKINFNFLQDWFCDKCEYKNFARRNRCNKCQNTRNANCKTAYSSSSGVGPSSTKNRQEDQSGNCSLMVRGNVIMNVGQDAILEVFQKLAHIKDIRMIKNKSTGNNKDFAFVEFFTAQETASAFKIGNQPGFMISGEPVAVLYSKNRKDERDMNSINLNPNRSDDFGYGAPPRRRREPRQPPTENYSQKERQRQIQMEKEKPLITMEQLKERKEAQMRKAAQNTTAKQLTAEQSRRRQVELNLKKWERDMKTVSEVLYLCPVCIRKFKDQAELRNHENLSERHKLLMQQFSKLSV